MEAHVEPLLKEHWPRVRAIYEEGIAAGQATFETEAPTWQRWDNGHHPHSRLVALSDEDVLGWAALSPVSRREVYRGVAEVSVYVTRAAQGMGLGTLLLRDLIAASEQAGIWMLQASLFPENEASLRLHRRCGFRLVGRRQRIARQRGVWRDTLLMERRSLRVGA